MSRVASSGAMPSQGRSATRYRESVSRQRFVSDIWICLVCFVGEHKNKQ